MKKYFKAPAFIAVLTLIAVTAIEPVAYARAGGGRSFGSRGSRSSYSPGRSYSRQSPYQQPSRDYTSPQQPRGSFLRGIGGGIVGGLIGGMLFRSLGFGGTGMGGGMGGGVGFLDILLLGGIAYMAYRMFKRRQAGASQNPPSMFRGDSAWGPDPDPYNVKEDIADIQGSDSSFTEAGFKDSVMDMFFRIQAAWMNRDLSSARTLLTDEMRGIMQGDMDALLCSKMINRLENIAVRSVEITEAWQEAGQDYITALIYANLLDYTVDEQSSNVVEGSKTEPVKFEEYWTFTRPSRSGQWMLSGIHQA